MTPSDRRFPRFAVLTVLIVLTAGCASVGTAPAGSQEQERVASRSKVVRETPVVTEEDDYGFTMTETVRIGSDVRRDYQQAIAMLQTDQLEAGISLLESVVERAPDVTIPHIDLGVAYARHDELDKAEESLKTALSLAPDHPAALNELGIVYRRTGRFDEARQSYESVLARHPGFHFALLNLGVLCDLYLDDLGCALDSYERYADIVTDDGQVDMWIADIRNRLGAGEE